MAKRKVSILLLMILLFYVPSNALANNQSNDVPQFGTDFSEVVIADSSDGLDDPRDLEFHPGRANELWIANRATDSISIIHNTGLVNQTSENRQDSHKNHFLEEVSAISFGSYHPEFDWQWGSAQESINTYCGQGSPNNFMGPTLWPSSLSHFAMEHQSDQYLGSHIDMNHESPFGMGIAHDSGNSYWYNDGYYEELVYYDFQEDHDTGMDDHSDGIVRRYSDIQLTHSYGTPGHMILDKDSGILYISDPGANRVLWVNTDDTTFTTQDIMSDQSRLEPLAEYSRITGIEWGILDSGLNKPSGIALEDGQLFISQKDDNQIIAYNLSSNGKSATEVGSIQTSASAIMGLEIGPDGHLYYVDNARDEVVRIDPLSDVDNDGIVDQDDNCPLVSNPNQSDHDSDLQGDACDLDDDDDGISDDSDNCPVGDLDWPPSLATDHDMDGCRDNYEDYDDDNDGVLDSSDSCQIGELGWLSNTSTDYDGDGCRDSTEDNDDDDDNICDSGWDESWGCLLSSLDVDFCPESHPTFTSSISNDGDQDGCEDRNEDNDDDNDGFLDGQDDCPIEAGSSDSGRLFGCLDTDGDGYADTIDEFPGESSQWSDIDEDGYGDESDGIEGDDCVSVYGTSSQDRTGCLDSDGDGYSNPDSNWGVSLGADAFADDITQHVDSDGDGFGDNQSGSQADECPEIAGNSSLDRLGCLDSDGDGWSDEVDLLPFDSTQYLDDDGDGFGDSQTGNTPDSCLGVYGLSNQEKYGCPDSDGDGWSDETDFYPDDSSRHVESESVDSESDESVESDSSNISTILIIIGITILGISLGLIMLIGRRNGNEIVTSNFSSASPNLEMAVNHGPPLPPEGLPAGWTMEQWAWYGEDYLKSR